MWFPVHLYTGSLPNYSGQLAELIVYIIPPAYVLVPINLWNSMNKFSGLKIESCSAIITDYVPLSLLYACAIKQKGLRNKV